MAGEIRESNDAAVKPCTAQIIMERNTDFQRNEMSLEVLKDNLIILKKNDTYFFVDNKLWDRSKNDFTEI